MRSHSFANRTPSGSGLRRRFVVWFFVAFDFAIGITPRKLCGAMVGRAVARPALLFLLCRAF